jgi:hypothetical protein
VHRDREDLALSGFYVAAQNDWKLVWSDEFNGPARSVAVDKSLPIILELSTEE